MWADHLVDEHLTVSEVTGSKFSVPQCCRVRTHPRAGRGRAVNGSVCRHGHHWGPETFVRTVGTQKSPVQTARTGLSLRRPWQGACGVRRPPEEDHARLAVCCLTVKDDRWIFRDNRSRAHSSGAGGRAVRHRDRSPFRPVKSRVPPSLASRMPGLRRPASGVPLRSETGTTTGDNLQRQYRTPAVTSQVARAVWRGRRWRFRRWSPCRLDRTGRPTVIQVSNRHQHGQLDCPVRVSWPRL